MKLQFAKAILAVFFFATLITSCSDKPNDDKLKEFIVKKEKSDIDKWAKDVLVNPCSFGRVIEIPKKFAHASDLVNAANNTDDYEIMITKEQNLLDKLALAGIIEMTKTKDETGINTRYHPFSSKEYDIEIGNKAMNDLLGQTGDSYILSLFDLKNLQIIKSNEKADTLTVDYVKKTTTTFDVLKEFCENSSEKNYLPTDTSSIELVKENGEWNIK